jgi:predicted PurR-regulated permease PerM
MDASPNMNLNRFFRVLSLLLGLGLFVFITWCFSSISIYIIISFIITLVCFPLKQLLLRIRYKKIKTGNTLATLLSLATVVAVLVLFFNIVFIPVVGEVNVILSIDTENIRTTYDSLLDYADGILKEYQIMNKEDDLQDIIINATFDSIRKINISSLFGNMIHVLSSIFIGIFSILFISFFFLKDFSSLQTSMVNILPTKHQDEGHRIIQRSKKLLSTYFLGLFVEMVLMGALEFIILSLLGIENALLISFLGGVLVIVPYVGSLIACFLGCIIAVISGYMLSPDVAISLLVMKIVGTFIFCRFLDNFFLQPFIASRTVKAHPLEIFIVVLLSGSLAGIPGMMLGIPAYTVIRIIAQELFGYTNFVKTLTSRLNKDKEENP